MQKDVIELSKWIRKLESAEGAALFKETMGVGDAEVQCEIQMCKTLLTQAFIGPDSVAGKTNVIRMSY